MKEEGKYYTPDIEEFHIGFECELMSSYGYLKGEWPNIMMEETHMMMRMERLGRDLTKMTKSGTFRVKYLDQEDIESLGFVKSDKLPISWETQSWFIYKASEMYGSNIYTIQKIKPRADFKRGNKFVRFSGEIKNKSELKRVLKQIGYEK